MSIEIEDIIENAFYCALNDKVGNLSVKEFNLIAKKALLNILKGIEESDSLLKKNPVKKVANKVSKVVKKKPVKHYTKWTTH